MSNQFPTKVTTMNMKEKGVQVVSMLSEPFKRYLLGEITWQEHQKLTTNRLFTGELKIEKYK